MTTNDRVGAWSEILGGTTAAPARRDTLMHRFVVIKRAGEPRHRHFGIVCLPSNFLCRRLFGLVGGQGFWAAPVPAGVFTSSDLAGA